MARQDSLQGSLPLLILKVLARRGSLHGYALSSHIEEMSEAVLQVEEGSLYPALLGIAAGAAGSLALAHYAESLLFDVRPTDALSILLPLMGLLAACVLAALGPTIRATKLDPVTTLRYE